MQTKINRQSFLFRKLRSVRLLSYVYDRAYKMVNDIRFLSKFRWKTARNINVLYFYISPYQHHPGLADRLKAIVNCYYIAKKNGYDFKIVFNEPFELKEFLVANNVDWYADESELEFSISKTRFLTCRGNFSELKPNKHYICFDYTGEMFLIFHTQKELWRSLFFQLFQFSPLVDEVAEKTSLQAHSFVAIHVRFVNALEKTERGSSELSEMDKTNLIYRCRNEVMRILKEESVSQPIVVFSDSSVFLRHIKDLPVMIWEKKDIGHISYTSNRQIVLNAFVDLALMSKARIIYRLLAPELYCSGFSEMAAMIGNIPRIDRKI